MSVTQQITDNAGSLFDVVGVSRLSSGDGLLILGLVIVFWRGVRVRDPVPLLLLIVISIQAVQE